MKKLLILLLFSASTFSNKLISQAAIIDSLVLFNQSTTLCESDTIYIYFRTSASFPAGPSSIEVDFPENYVPDGNAQFPPFPPISPSPFNASNNSFRYPLNAFPNQTYSIKIPFKVSCGGKSDFIAINILDGSNNPLLANYSNTPYLTVFTPELTIKGLQNTSVLNQNTYLSGLTMDLDSILPERLYVRCFEVELQTIFGDVENLTIQTDANNYSIEGVSNGATVTVANGIATYEFDIFDMGGPLSLSNSIFTFCDTVKTNFSCNDNNILNGYMEAFTDCGSGELCSSTTPAIISPYGRIQEPNGALAPTGTQFAGHVLTSTGAISWTGYSPCEQNVREITVRNTSNIVDTILGAVYDFNLRVGSAYPIPNFTTTSSIVIDSVIVDGVQYPFSPCGGTSGLQCVNFGANPPAAFQDIDTTGVRNDLPPGATLTVRVYFKTPSNTFTGCENYDTPNNLDDLFRPQFNYIRIWPEYTSYCKNTDLTYLNQSLSRFDIGKNPTSFTYPPRTISPLTSLPVTISGRSTFSGVDRNRFVHKQTLIMPKGFYIDTPTFNWTTHTGACGPGNYGFTVTYGSQYDTIHFNSDCLPAGNNMSFDLKIDCDSLNFSCSSLSSISSLERKLRYTSLIYTVDDQGIACDSFQNICREGYELDWTCTNTGSLFEHIESNVNRATFGWTDTTMTTRVNRNTPGVILNKGYNFDTIRVNTKVAMSDTSSTGYVTFKYNHPYGDVNLGTNNGFDPLQLISNTAMFTVNDISSNTKRSFRVNSFQTVNSSLVADGFTFYRLDIRNYIDSMRLATGNPNYIFGGELNTTGIDADTLELELYFYCSRPDVDFKIQSKTGWYDSVYTNITGCNQLRGISIDYEDYSSHQYENRVTHLSRGNRNYCNDFSFSFGNLLLGPTVNSSFGAGITEFRPISVIDRYIITWDPSEFLVCGDTAYWDNTNYYADISDPGMPSNAFYLSPTKDTMIIYADRVNERFNGLSTGRKGFAIPFRAGCNRTAASRVFIEAIGRDYVDGIGGNIPYSYVTSRVMSGSDLDIELIPLNRDGQITKDTTCWDIFLNNDLGSDMPNAWLSLKSLQGNASPIVSVNEVSIPSTPVAQTITNFNNPSYGTGQFIDLDTVVDGELLKYRLCAVNSCSADSIELVLGYNCKDTVNPATLTYDNQPAANCFDNFNRDTLYQLIPIPIIEQASIQAPNGFISFCDTISYELNVRNSGTIESTNLVGRLRQIGLGSQLNYIPGTSAITWNNISTTKITINDPTQNANGDYIWNFGNQLFGDSLPGVSIPDSNSFYLSFDLTLGCPIFLDDQFLFEVVYDYDENLCTDSVSNLALPPLQINGVPANPSNQYDITLNTEDGNICDSSNLAISVSHNGGFGSLGNEIIMLRIDSNFRIDENLKNVFDPTNLLSSQTPDSIYFDRDQLIYEWKLGTTSTGDSLYFETELYPHFNSSISCIDSAVLNLIVGEVYNLSCSNDPGVFCPTILIINQVNDTVNVNKHNISLAASSVTISTCQSFVDYTINITNDGIDTIKAGTTYTIDFLNDLNCNRIIDPSDQQINTLNYTFSSDLSPDSTVSVNNVAGVTVAPNDTCGFILSINSDNQCICFSSIDSSLTSTYDPCGILISEFISPNNDGQNDTWVIERIDNYPNGSVKIFNRFGALVYETVGYKNDWDGESNTGIKLAGSGASLPSGTYFYIIDLKDENYEVFTGNVHIRR